MMDYNWITTNYKLKYKIGDKVKLKHKLFKYGGNEFWYKNINTIFTIHFVDTFFYTYYKLCYPNDEIVMCPLDETDTAVFFNEELELYTVNNILPDELFEVD